MDVNPVAIEFSVPIATVRTGVQVDVTPVAIAIDVPAVTPNSSNLVAASPVAVKLSIPAITVEPNNMVDVLPVLVELAIPIQVVSWVLDNTVAVDPVPLTFNAKRRVKISTIPTGGGGTYTDYPPLRVPWSDFL